MKIVELELKDLTIPQGLLPRVLTGTVEEKVEEYKEMIEEGVEFDPVLVWEREDGTYWVIDGVHRIEAHKRAGKERIKAKLVKCRDELEYRIKAIQANLKHGLALSKGERPLLAQTLYRQGLSEEEIRKVFGVSKGTVRKWLAPVKQEEKEKKIRKALELRERGWSLEKIAKELGVGKTTVKEWLDRSEMVKDTKTELLLPTGDPTPEGLKLWGEFVLEAQKLGDIFSDSTFYDFIRDKGYQVEMHSMFLAEVRERIYSYINRLVSSGLKLRQIQEAMVYEREGIFEYLSTPAKKKLALLMQSYIEKKIEEKKRLTELELKSLEAAKEIIRDPEFVFSNWTDLAIKVREKMGHDLPTRGDTETRRIADLLKLHSDTLMDLYHQIPEVPGERVKKILENYDLSEFEDLVQLIETVKASVIQEGYRWTTKAEWIVINAHNEYVRSTPSSPPSHPSSAGPQPALSEENPEDYLKNVKEEDVIKVQEYLDEKLNENGEQKKRRPGRPKKEPLPLDRRQLEYWRDQILNILYDVAMGWGWEEAERILKEATEEFYETKESSVR